MNREQFLALLARLRGEGDALTVEEIRSLVAYVTEAGIDRDVATDEELVEIRSELRALGGTDAPLDEIEAAVEVVQAIAAVDTLRVAADDELAERRQALLDALGTDEVEPEPEPEPEPAAGDEPDPDPETEVVVPAETPSTPDEVTAETDPAGTPELVGATASAPARRRAPGELRSRRPAGAVAELPPVRTANRILKDGDGEFATLGELAGAMVEKRRRFLNANNGVSEYLTMGTIEAEYPAERLLDFETDPSGSDARLSAVSKGMFNLGRDELAAVTASGGPCAPAVPYYGIARLGDTDRPFRGSLQQFGAPRGRITFRVPPDFPSFAAASSQWTLENDTVPGSAGPTTKPCMVVPCPGTEAAEIYAVTECLTFGNFMTKYDPEATQNAIDNQMVAFARRAETLLIDAMKASSTLVTSGKALGAFRDLVYDIGVAAAGYRSRHRMRRDAQLEVRLPNWVDDAVMNDLLRSLPGDNTLVGVEAIWERALAERNITVAGYYMDSPTGVGQQVFGPQHAGGLVDFPEVVQWQICAPGTFVLLDNGRLDIGVVRDSTLVKTNDYMTFAETFEGLAMLGLDSMWVTSTVCASGQSSGTVDASAFCAGDYVPA